MAAHRPTARIDAHGMRWLAVRGFAQALPRLELERARHPDRLGPDELVKDNTVRTVLRMPDPLAPDGPGLFVKRYKFRDLYDRLRYVVAPTKPEQEWRVCRALQAAGIPTCDVLAIGVRRRRLMPREGFLVSREVSGAVVLGELLREPGLVPRFAEPAFRRELIEEASGLSAALADGGFTHTDYHAGNLLVRPDEPAGRRLYVTDLHAIRLRRPRRRGVARMLGMLAYSTDRAGAEHDDQALFLRQFLRRRQAEDARDERTVAEWARRVKRAEARLRRRHMRSRTRRCLTESSLFTRGRAEGLLVHRRRDFALEGALQAVRRHRTAVAGDAGAAEVIKLDASSRTVVSLAELPAVPPPGDDGQPAGDEELRPGRVCVKQWRRDRWRDRLKDLFRPRSRARAAYVAHRGAHVRGIPAARPLALLEATSVLGGRPDWVVMEALETDGPLDEQDFGALGDTARRALGRAVADLLDRLARAEVYHADTKPGNFLVRREGEGFRLYLVDLDRMRFDARMTRGRWVKSLARLNSGLGRGVSLLDRMRVLRRCGRGRWRRAERLAIARDVYALSLTRRPAWLRADHAGTTSTTGGEAESAGEAEPT